MPFDVAAPMPLPRHPSARSGLPAGLTIVVALVALGSALIGVGGRATYGAATSADEPYYLLTAGSMVAGEGLDIAPGIQRNDFRAYHEVELDPQARPQPDGRLVSPHDPLLPALSVPAYALAEGLGVGGWIGVKIWLSLLAAATAVATFWVAVARSDAKPTVAALVVSGAFAGLPLSAYGSQVYPEIPAALVVTLAAGVLLSPWSARLRIAGPLLLSVGVVALPWLSIKYAPIAALLATLMLRRVAREFGTRHAVAVLGGLALAGGLYLAAHQAWYAGWTVYAAGDHFVDTGELAVVGVSPHYLGRAQRLVGLLVDSRFGVATWSPLWLLLPAAVGAAVRHSRLAVVWGTLAVGWLVASFVALTMHGWWVPGRQIVVVLPLGAVLIAGLLTRVPSLRPVGVLAAVAGATNWAWLAVESTTGSRTLIVDFFETAALPYRALSAITPDGLASSPDPVSLLLWTVGLLFSAWWGWSVSRDDGAERAARHDVPPAEVPA